MDFTTPMLETRAVLDRMGRLLHDYRILVEQQGERPTERSAAALAASELELRRSIWRLQVER